MNEQLTSTWEILDEAHRVLRTVVNGVGPDDWERPTPCAQWNVTQVLQHAAGDQRGFAATITGSGFPSYDPFAPDGHLHGEDPAEFAEDGMRAAAAAWATVAHDAADAPTPLPQGRLAPQIGAGVCALDAAVHAWDIAAATGQPSPLTPELARDLLAVAQEIVEPLRQWGAYAAVVPAEAGDDEVAALLRYLGRDPNWAA
ncbi:TIGR03086 family metal-binding protein [Dactylosporangium salmoneum]|uniref:Mycothiol-dependent maleylpyruvate isomerase metal-binding domain-containing protein n=1 Tax=Dactylosporangium salmoneum TaxID=53361 RepID=A0ABP5V082_9ACTN